MASSHLLATKSGAYATRGSSLWPPLGMARPGLVGLAHLTGMNSSANTQSNAHSASRVETGQGSIEPVLTLAEIATHLGVSVQALYDLRNKGRGPRGFKVGRHLHFRVSEVDAWLRQLEAQDSCPAAAPPPAVPPPAVPLTEEPTQELAGEQWALLLDLPERP